LHLKTIGNKKMIDLTQGKSLSACEKPPNKKDEVNPIGITSRQTELKSIRFFYFQIHEKIAKKKIVGNENKKLDNRKPNLIGLLWLPFYLHYTYR